MTDPRAVIFAVLAVLFMAGRVHAQTLDTPENRCGGAVDVTACYTQYVADRLYERAAVDVGTSSFLGMAGPALAVFGSFGLGLLMTRWRV